MLTLDVILVSTRPGRAGEPVGQWFAELARKHGKFDVRWVNLKAMALPLFDEDKHPRLKQYEHPHTRAWSAVVDEADAFVFVTPEYNFFAPPSFVNAVTFLFQEWQYKPAAFVSYGGASGGMRAAQAEKQLLTSVKVMPIPEAVALPAFMQSIHEGIFKPSPQNEQSAATLLDELAKWGHALKSIRSVASAAR